MSEFDRLVGELEARLDQLADSTLERLRERSPGWVLQTAVSHEQIAKYARASLKVHIRAFQRDALPKEISKTDAAAAIAAAKVGELDTLLSGFRSAQMILWESWFCIIEDSPDLQGIERRELLTRGSDFFFRYADLLSDYVSAAAQQEIDQLRGNAEQRRYRAIRSLLEGEPLTKSPGLDLDLNQHHLGLFAWGEGGADAARELTATLDRRLLIVAPLERSWWGWISGARPFEPQEERAAERFRGPQGAGLALGLPAFGEAGFRATHRQAQRARWFAQPGGPTLIRYADVAIESLAGENQEDARTFVERELGPIGDESASSRRIRETLQAYFAAEHNAASAAATLGVHQQTVANRLRSAEERLGHPIGSRRLELEVALRLRAALNHNGDS
jgi:DNA-binding PucR family transcriptional regulator